MTKKKTTSGAGKTVAKLKAKKENQEKQEPPQKVQPAHQPSIQAMVWYKEEHYQELLELFEDRDLLPPTFAAWLARAEAKKIEVEAEGDQVMKVFIEPETFSDWCKDKKMPPTAEARSQLAIEVAQARSFSL